MKVLVTGVAGFIGFHLTRRLVADGVEVVGLDNLNDYYDVDLKLGRLGALGINPEAAESATGGVLASGGAVVTGAVPLTGDPKAAGAIPATGAVSAPGGAPATPGDSVSGDSAPAGRGASDPAWSGTGSLRFVKLDLADQEGLLHLLETERFDRICHLAAQAGVRYSLTNPHAYIESNIAGFLNLLEAVRTVPVEHLVYASSSSVYGVDREQPFREDMAADHPASLYAASKRSNELIAHSYSHLYRIPTTGLRFFTVYGSWYRPDMALYRFADAMTAGKPIQVYNYGTMERDFTYIDDIVEGVVRVINGAPGTGGASGAEGAPGAGSAGYAAGAPGPGADTPRSTTAPHRVYNIGNGAPVPLMELIGALEDEFGIVAEKEMLPMQPGDVTSTWADCSALERDFGYRPNTPIRQGVAEFVRWYRSYHHR